MLALLHGGALAGAWELWAYRLVRSVLLLTRDGGLVSDDLRRHSFGVVNEISARGHRGGGGCREESVQAVGRDTRGLICLDILGMRLQFARACAAACGLREMGP